MIPQTIHSPLPGTQIDPLYPDSDGRPLGDTEFHSAAMIWLREALQDHFAGRSDVYVASNLLLYYQQGNPAGRRDPDVLVAKGVGNHVRRSFRVWEEGVMPQVLFEIASESTWREDLGVKRTLYASLGVREYFLFDPEGGYLDPRLQGFRLDQGAFVPLTPAVNGALESAELGLRFVPEGAMLRLIDAATGVVVPTRSERADQLTEEVVRLQALLRQRNGNK
jgi:Uma2 family endonuclease